MNGQRTQKIKEHFEILVHTGISDIKVFIDMLDVPESYGTSLEYVAFFKRFFLHY